MSTLRFADVGLSKIARGSLYLGPIGSNILQTAGNAIVEEQVTTDSTDIRSVEDPFLAIQATVVTDMQMMLKLTCRSFTALVKSLAHMAPAGETWTQGSVDAGSIAIPAGTKDGATIIATDANGNRVFDIIVAPADIATAAIIVDSEAGMIEVIGDRAVASAVPYTAPAVTSAANRALLRSLQKGEIRQQARFRERNRFGKNQVHDWPVLSLKASGNRKLSDDGKEIQSLELDARVEYDRNSIGRERGDVIEIN